LSEIQIAELFDPPTEQRELVRYYTLSEADLAAIARCRGDHNRLGHALMRCYLRYPGRVLHVGERPPAAMLEFVAEQIGVFPAFIDEYLASERNRQRHAIECQDQIGLESDHVFALCTPLGFVFAPRIPDLKHRRLYSFGKPSDYPTLEPLIAGPINVELIRTHWAEILRIVASIRAGTVAPSVIMRQLGSYPRQNGMAAALRELGRLERTLFTLDWVEDPELRRETGQELNKGESRNSLARAVFIHRLGEIRDRTYENQQHRASGLNLIVTAIILWNTRYLERAVATLRQTEDVPDHLLAHLSPLGWEHINLTGDYIWVALQETSENSNGLRPLRTPPEAFGKAA
jgi:TnpA family transposase